MSADIVSGKGDPGGGVFILQSKLVGMAVACFRDNKQAMMVVPASVLFYQYKQKVGAQLVD